MSEGDPKTPETTAKPVIKIELKIDEKLAGGEYANICMVNHSDSEFILDSFFLQPGRPQAMMKGRLILAPRNAKRLMMMLTDQVKRYEQRFGEIEIHLPGPSVSLVH
jgi:hypothetical protein